MSKKERSYWYWNVLQRYDMKLEKNFYELDNDDIFFLANLADAIRCKGEDGKSPARTLWDRAKEGRPF